MIRDNTHSTDSFTLFSEMEGDANSNDLDNYPLDLFPSSDSYVQQKRTSYIFPAHNGLGSFGTDGSRKKTQGYNRVFTFGNTAQNGVLRLTGSPRQRNQSSMAAAALMAGWPVVTLERVRSTRPRTPCRCRVMNQQLRGAHAGVSVGEKRPAQSCIRNPGGGDRSIMMAKVVKLETTTTEKLVKADASTSLGLPSMTQNFGRYTSLAEREKIFGEESMSVLIRNLGAGS